jgi:hypothetical protein
MQQNPEICPFCKKVSFTDDDKYIEHARRCREKIIAQFIYTNSRSVFRSEPQNFEENYFTWIEFADNLNHSKVSKEEMEMINSTIIYIEKSLIIVSKRFKIFSDTLSAIFKENPQMSRDIIFQNEQLYRERILKDERIEMESIWRVVLAGDRQIKISLFQRENLIQEEKQIRELMIREEWRSRELITFNRGQIAGRIIQEKIQREINNEEIQVLNYSRSIPIVLENIRDIPNIVAYYVQWNCKFFNRVMTVEFMKDRELIGRIPPLILFSGNSPCYNMYFIRNERLILFDFITQRRFCCLC